MPSHHCHCRDSRPSPLSEDIAKSDHENLTTMLLERWHREEVAKAMGTCCQRTHYLYLMINTYLIILIYLGKKNAQMRDNQHMCSYPHIPDCRRTAQTDHREFHQGTAARGRHNRSRNADRCGGDGHVHERAAAPRLDALAGLNTRALRPSTTPAPAPLNITRPYPP
jgi:hypothetical protein